MVPARLVVLVSGTGRRLDSLRDACRDVTYGAVVVAVGSDRPGAAEPDEDGAGPATFAVPLGDYRDRESWEDALCAAILPYEPDFVVCVGFEAPLSGAVLHGFPRRVLATHASLLPAFPGPQPVAEALAYGAKVTGATVYLLDSGSEPGPVVAQAPVVVRSDDDERTLGARIAAAERALLVHAVGRLARSGFRVDGRKVILP